MTRNERRTTAWAGIGWLVALISVASLMMMVGGRYENDTRGNGQIEKMRSKKRLLPVGGAALPRNFPTFIGVIFRL